MIIYFITESAFSQIWVNLIKNIRNYTEKLTYESYEVYILSEVSMDNIKIRENLTDISRYNGISFALIVAFLIENVYILTC